MIDLPLGRGFPIVLYLLSRSESALLFLILLGNITISLERGSQVKNLRENRELC